LVHAITILHTAYAQHARHGPHGGGKLAISWGVVNGREPECSIAVGNFAGKYFFCVRRRSK